MRYNLSELPNTGNGYAGFFTYQFINGDYREYIQIELNEELILGEKYIVQFYVSLADSMLYGCNDIGVYLSTQGLSAPFSQSYLPYMPQASNSSIILAHKKGWQLVADTIIAAGGEKFITVGNFKPDNLSDYFYLGGNSTWEYAYYYIDDIYVGSIDTPISIQDNIDVLFSLFPNPASESVNIKLPSNQNECSLKVYDAFGNIKYNESKIQNIHNVNTTDFSNGVYYFILQRNNKTIFNKKIIINH